MGYTYPGKQVALGGGRGWLDAAAAASIKRIDAAIGHMLQITEAGRSFFTQEKHWLKYLRDGYPIALNPNTPSEHQKGKAIDSDEAQRFIALMEEHGWFRTVYRWVNGKWTLVERWHFEYFIDRDKRRNDPAPSGGGQTPIEEILMAQGSGTEVIVTDRDKNGKAIADKARRMAYVNTESGFNVDFSWLTLKDADAAAAKVGMPKGAIRMTDVGFDKFIARLDAIAAKS